MCCLAARSLFLLLCVLVMAPAGLLRAEGLDDVGAPVTGWTDAVLLDVDYVTAPLGQKAAFLEDPDSSLTLQDVMSEAWSDRFLASSQDVPVYGFKASAFWMRMDIRHEEPLDGSWLFELAYAPMQYVDVYLVDQSGALLKEMRGGANVRYDLRPYPHRTHVFPLPLQRGKLYTLYMRVAGESSKTLPVKLWRAEEFSREASTTAWGLGIFFGVMLGLLGYNLIICMIVREVVYFWYVCFLGSFSTFALMITGIGHDYFSWLPLPVFSRLTPMAMGLAGLFGSVFAVTFLGLRESLPGVYRVARWAVLVPVSVMLLSVVGTYHAAVSVGAVYTLFYSLFFTGLGAICVYRGVASASYYLAAWLVLLASVSGFALRSMGLIESSHVTEYGQWYGAASQAVLLSLAMAATMRRMKEEVAAAQQALLNQLQSESHRLESEVLARTEQLVKAQQELVQKEKLASVGVLAAGVAHEINNPNNFVAVGAQNALALNQSFRHFVDAILDDDGDQDIRRAFMEKFDRMDGQLGLIDEGSKRIATIVSGLQSVTHLNDTEQREIDVVDGFDNTVMLLEPQLKKGISFSRDFQARPKVLCWGAEINQVFMNLLVNACQAVSDRPRSDATPPGEITLMSRLAGDSLELVIADNGVGMSDYVRNRAFDPFFTTRPVGSGSGLGLSSSLDVVKKHGGRMEIQTSEGAGCSVHIFLPLTAGAPSSEGPAIR
jgi:two-component system NtrC family sensor kinase